MLHGAPDGHPDARNECPRRVEVIKERLEELEEDLVTGNDDNATDGESRGGGQRFLPILPRHATRSEVELVHTSEHYDYLQSISNLSREELKKKSAAEENSKDLVWNEHTFDAALFAAGCAIECVDKVTTKHDGGCTRAISVTRPPGHHASAGSAGGFCYLNNIALAARWALANGRAKRVVIIDPDIHHGNGTQDITYDNENIFFISLHRYEVDQNDFFYPGTGQPNECGSTKAKGMNLNVAWSEPDMGDPEFAAALSELILPVISAFHPDLFLISAGFDAAEGDTIGDCSLSCRGYYAMTRSLLKTIGHDVPVVAILHVEGGYNLSVIPGCMEAVALAFLDETFEPALRDLVKADSLPRELLEELLFGPIDDDGNGELDVGIEPRSSIAGTNDKPLRGVKLSAIQDINLSMQYLRKCPFWKDMWSMNIVDLHDIPESAGVGDVDEVVNSSNALSTGVSALENMLGGLKI